MKRLWILIGLVAVGAAAYAVWSTTARRSWTTDSPEALAAYESGRQAQMKYYGADAAKEFRRALELDPGFVIAKVALLETGGTQSGERSRLIEDLRRADRARLTERERLLVDVAISHHDDDFQALDSVLSSYLADHPNDPWALMVVATDAWHRQDWEQAERDYKRLLEVDPNWLMARNNLGYIAMAQGRFDEAEEQFRTYRYAAPDQANPHDSLGELLVVLGRYTEARAELEEALAARPDFCGSYENLFRLMVLERKPGELLPLADRVQENCNERMADRFGCMAQAARAFLGELDAVPWDDETCASVLHEADPLTHLLALTSGRPELAAEMEQRMSAVVEKYGERASRGAKNANATLALLEGQRLLLEGKPAEAVLRLRVVDADSTWWGSGGGAVVKLIARVTLARALTAAGEPAEAKAVLARLREVNPDFAERFSEFMPGPRKPTG